MPAKLHSVPARVLWVVVCCALVAGYLHAAFRVWRALRASGMYTSASLERAIRLEPTNAFYRDLLGRYSFVDEQNAPKALGYFQQATAIDPYNASYWLDIAHADERLGDPAQQSTGLERALYAEPTTPSVAWEAGNFALLRGDTTAALARFRVVIANDPELAPQAMDLAWRATGNPEQVIAQALPERIDVYQQFLQLAIAKGNSNAAQQVWAKMLALEQPFSFQSAFPYLDFLLSQHEVAAADAGWASLAQRNPALRPYLSTPQDRIVNGSFELPLLNGGFDWRYSSTPAITLGVDNTTFHSGNTSLQITFDNSYAPDAGISQSVPVTPGLLYDFTAWVKTADMEGAEGPRLEIRNPDRNQILFTSEDYLGNNPWREVHGRLRVSDETPLLRIGVVRRDAEKSPIKGKLWLDDVSLAEVK